MKKLKIRLDESYYCGNKETTKILALVNSVWDNIGFLFKDNFPYSDNEAYKLVSFNNTTLGTIYKNEEKNIYEGFKHNHHRSDISGNTVEEVLLEMLKHSYKTNII